MPSPTLNIAFYRFCDLGRPLTELRASLREECFRLGLRGTILLAEEGMNGFVAGSENSVRDLQSLLRAMPPLADLEFKESWSSDRPFNRMLVKIKREIIPLGRPEVNPARTSG